MESLQRYRALGSLCRQQAAYNPDQSWKHWEHLAQTEASSHFKECNATSSSDLAKSGAPRDVTGSRWKAIAAA